MRYHSTCRYFRNSRFRNAKKELVATSKLETKAKFLLENTFQSKEELVSYCNDVCPYEAVIEAAKIADIVIVNYKHIFDANTDFYTRIETLPQNVYLLIDEAHNVGNVVQSIQTVELNNKDFDFIKKDLKDLSAACEELRPQNDCILASVNVIERFVIQCIKSDLTEDIFDNIGLEKDILHACKIQDFKVILRIIENISDKIDEKKLNEIDVTGNSVAKMKLFFEKMILAKTDISYFPIVTKDNMSNVTLGIRNIDPSGTIRKVVHVHSCCIMISGTFSHLEAFQRYYFGSEKVFTSSVPNSFPNDHRKVISVKGITSRYEEREESLKYLIGFIEIYSKIDGNLAVFFPSYELMHTFKSKMPELKGQKDIFIEPRDSRESDKLIDEFKSLPENGRSGIMLAVCGGKWSEGLDYSGNTLVGAFVYGLPLARWGNVQKIINTYYTQKYGRDGIFIAYTLPAINKAVQSLGRVIRSKSDYGILILADERYQLPANKRALPGWIQDETILCNSEDFQRQVQMWNIKRKQQEETNPPVSIG